MVVRIEFSTADAVVGVWERVVIVVWRRRTTVPLLRQAEEVLVRRANESANRVLLLTIVEGRAALPSFGVRGEIASMLKRANGRIVRSALAFEGEGVRADSIRALVAGVSLFAGPEYPHRVFSSVAGAVRFLMGDRETSFQERLLAAVAEVRRRLYAIEGIAESGSRNRWLA